MVLKTTESITCDCCGKELICNTSYPAVYALELSGINVNRNDSGSQFPVMVSKPDTRHFCNGKCVLAYFQAAQ